MRYQVPAFTLVETLMVMVVLGMVMLAASGLASTVIRSASQNQARVQAIYLTQECSELVRNVRDSSWRQNLDWRCPFLSGGVIDTDHLFTIEATGISSVPVADCQQNLGVSIQPTTLESAMLYTKPGLGFTHQLTDAESPFQRYVSIDGYDDVLQALDLTCHTVWSGGRTQISQRLTNWRQP